MQNSIQLVALFAALLAVCSCAKTSDASYLASAAQRLSDHPCLKTAQIEIVRDRDVAAVAHCKAEFLVVFYKPNGASGSRHLSSINVNEPLASLPEFMNIYQPVAGLTARLGPPDKTERNLRNQTITYNLPDGVSIAFDVVSNGHIGHITFYWPAIKA